ncbi:MAG: hypothetical protein GY737_00340 [Desulfobacteraceae bacterium]|nr:hypothetical protein [Desulfobacteraceae bacterium]
MNLGGGKDRLNLAPLRPDGSRYMEDFSEEFIGNEDEWVDIVAHDPSNYVGCHVGDYMGLNVFNAKPEMTYSWAVDKDVARLAAAQRGAEIVQAEDQEMAAYRLMSSNYSTPLDSSNSGYPGMVLLRTPNDVERARREREQALHQKRFRSGVAENTYKEGSNSSEVSAAHAANRDALRFARRDHRTKVVAGATEDADTLLSWSADIEKD